MTIKTLEHIHRLLIAEKEKRESAYEICRDVRNKAEDNDSPNLSTLDGVLDVARKKVNEASDALIEFELVDW